MPNTPMASLSMALCLALFGSTPSKLEPKHFGMHLKGFVQVTFGGVQQLYFLILKGQAVPNWCNASSWRTFVNDSESKF
jgi:hypothetical protein